MENTIYIIGDVHGCYEQLNKIWEFIQIDSQKRKHSPLIIFLGDLVDRGPNSKFTMDTCYTMQQESNCIFIEGNHDSYFKDLLNNQLLEYNTNKNWRTEEDAKTLWDYDDQPIGVELMDYFKPEKLHKITEYIRNQTHHMTVLNSMVQSHQIDSYYFTHMPHEKLRLKENLILVHGHYLNHSELPEIYNDKKAYPRTRVSLDTGSYKYGKLTCMVIDPSLPEVEFHQANHNKVFQVEPIIHTD